MYNMKDSLIIGASVVSLVGIGAAFAYVGAPSPAPMPSYEACPSEDYVPAGAPCVWSAALQGNGEGRSFVTFNDGSVSYLD